MNYSNIKKIIFQDNEIEIDDYSTVSKSNKHMHYYLKNLFHLKILEESKKLTINMFFMIHSNVYWIHNVVCSSL